VTEIPIDDINPLVRLETGHKPPPEEFENGRAAQSGAPQAGIMTFFGSEHDSDTHSSGGERHSFV
jgi:hypothetical protein